VKHATVLGELFADVPVEAGIVRHERAGTMHIGDDRRADILGVDIGNMERTSATVTLD